MQRAVEGARYPVPATDVMRRQPDFLTELVRRIALRVWNCHEWRSRDERRAAVASHAAPIRIVNGFRGIFDLVSEAAPVGGRTRQVGETEIGLHGQAEDRDIVANALP